MTKDDAMTLWDETSHQRLTTFSSNCHNWQGSTVLAKSLATART